MPDPTELQIVQQQLAEVRSAISAAVTRKTTFVSSPNGGRRVDQQDIDKLTARETELVKRVARLSRGCIRPQYVVPS